MEILRGIYIKIFRNYSPVNCVAFSPNREYLASGSNDNTVGIWRVSRRKRIKLLLVTLREYEM